MSSENDRKDEAGLNRRHFLAAGAAGLAAAGVGLPSVAAAAPTAPGKQPRTNSPTGKRVAIVTDTQLNIGPYLAREFARLGYGLVIADVRKGLEKELEDLGAYKVVAVPGLEQEGPNHEGRPGAIQKVVDAAIKEFGGYDSVFIRTAWHGGKSILEETPENMKLSYEQNCLAVMYALQAALPPLMEAGGGQVVVQTSATGEKPAPGLISYSVMRAAANMMVRCAALTAAAKGVCVNAVGTNFMNYPGFKHTLGADKDPKIMERLLDIIPMGRLGETAEAAHFTLSLLDGYNLYTTGNFFPVAGGFNNAGMTF
jgi:3-oxoacyl-[acyl-carrier protein] reductase